MNSIVWFRRDLRIKDNSALYHSTQKSDGVVGVYFLTPSQWKEHDDAECKIVFWLESLRQLSNSLSKLNIPLIVESVEKFALVPSRLIALANQLNCASIYFNREYEVNESKRDNLLLESAKKDGNIVCYHFDDRIIVPPDEIKTKEDRFYSVFTPYRRVWDKRFLEFSKPLPAPKKQPKQNVEPTQIPEQLAGFDRSTYRADLWPAGEIEAEKRMNQFAEKIANYQNHRDLPAINGTSLLSPYLNIGSISPRQCLSAAVEAADGNLLENDGATTWVSELTWRDFYSHVLVGCPRVSMHRPFKLKTESIRWRDDEIEFQAWCDGETGYPIVDAGMRQLNQTGWMHNRLRMVTAMFLSKHLLIDWRRGEQYFMQKLIDGDLAANNGGWQWSASTGTDSVPYFRIFNPFSQSKRFDKDGVFIKKFCPELNDLLAPTLHEPKKLQTAVAEFNSNYPDFIVDHKFARERVLSEFKAN